MVLCDDGSRITAPWTQPVDDVTADSGIGTVPQQRPHLIGGVHLQQHHGGVCLTYRQGFFVTLAGVLRRSLGDFGVAEFNGPFTVFADCCKDRFELKFFGIRKQGKELVRIVG